MALTRLSNQSLTSISSLPAAISTGKILQVVNVEKITQYSSNSNSANDLGLTLSITPSATNSKILIQTDLSVRVSANTYIAVNIYRQINGGGYSALDRLDESYGYYINAANTDRFNGMKIDTTHNTTNQIDYKIYLNNHGGGTYYVNPDTANNLSNFTAMEISA
jgi:hypothetical protein